MHPIIIPFMSYIIYMHSHTIRTSALTTQHQLTLWLMINIAAGWMHAAGKKIAFWKELGNALWMVNEFERRKKRVKNKPQQQTAMEKESMERIKSKRVQADALRYLSAKNRYSNSNCHSTMQWQIWFDERSKEFPSSSISMTIFPLAFKTYIYLSGHRFQFTLCDMRCIEIFMPLITMAKY